MVRKSMRVGLRLGLLAAVFVALVKVVQARRERDEDWPEPAAGRDWPPIGAEPVVVAPVVAEPVVAEPVVAEPVGEPVPPMAPAEPVAGPQAPAPVAPGGTGDWPPVQADPVVIEPVPQSGGDDGAPVVKKAPAPRPVARRAPASDGSGAASTTRSSRTAGRRRRPVSNQAWVEPVGSACPPSHPIKGKLARMLYHLPGMAFYDRTRPDRCYADEPAAQADELTRAKR